MSSKSRRKRKRAQVLARGDRCNPSAPRTGKGPLFDWTDAGVRDLVLLQRAIATGRLTPSIKGRRILNQVAALFNDETRNPVQRIEAFRAIIVATRRADLAHLRELLRRLARES